MRTPELSIVVPSLNEADNLPALVAELHRICAEHNINAEVIISDDASEDSTLAVARRVQSEYPDLGIRVLHRYEPRRGYGAVVRYGLAHATGRFAIIVAADGQNPIDMLPEMLREARSGAHLVQCSRYSGTEQPVVPARFRIYQTLFRRAARLLLGRYLPDSTYGFKLFDRVLVMALGVTSNRFNVSPEIMFKVMLSGGKIVFLPARQKPREHGRSKFSLHRELDGFAYILLRAWLHRLGVLWF